MEIAGFNLNPPAKFGGIRNLTDFILKCTQDRLFTLYFRQAHCKYHSSGLFSKIKWGFKNVYHCVQRMKPK